jgi:hypothetical protein
MPSVLLADCYDTIGPERANPIRAGAQALSPNPPKPADFGVQVRLRGSSWQSARMAGGLWQPEGESTEQVPPPPPGPRGLLPVHAEDPQRQAAAAGEGGPAEVPAKPPMSPAPSCRSPARGPRQRRRGTCRMQPRPLPRAVPVSERSPRCRPAKPAGPAAARTHRVARPHQSDRRPPAPAPDPVRPARPRRTPRPPPTTGPRSVVRVRPRRISPPVGAATLALSASRPIKFRFRAGHP